MDPTQNNAQPPSATSASSVNADVGLPPASGQDSELYNQIAGQDVEMPVVKKKGRSPLIALMAGIMRVTLWIDSMKRTHERFFHALGVIWTIFMSLLYFSGILMLVFAVYNRMQLPIYLEDQLRARNVNFEEAEYGMDRIIVHNLKDEAGNYTVDTMVIYSTFTDLLQKRIRLVSLDGLNILVNTKEDFNFTKDVPELLAQIQNPTRGRLDVAVNAVTINNAKLTFTNQEVEIPVTFSMEGIYGDSTQIVLPLSINQTALQAKATLTIAGTNRNPEWTLSVSEGVVTLPRSAPENISGDFKLFLDNDILNTIQADFKLGYGTIEKHITANLTANGSAEEGFGGQIVWEKNNLTEQNLSSDMTFKIDKISLKNTSDLQISGPVSITSNHLVLTDFAMTGLQVQMNTQTRCENWKRCVVDIKDPATVVIQDLLLQYQRQLIRNKDPMQFFVQPQENALVIQEQNPYISYEIPFHNFLFDGKFDESGGNMNVESTELVMAGAVADESDESSRLSVNAKNVSYTTPTLMVKNANINIANLLQKTSSLQVQAEEVQLLNTPVLSNPFEMTLNMVGQQAVARLQLKDNPVLIQLEGQLSFAQQAFAGQIRTNTIDLSQLTGPMQKLWPDLPSSFKDFSGYVTLYGQLKWMGPHSIVGPLNIGMKDVSFATEEMEIKGINTVLTLDAIQPLIAKQNQHVYVKEINGLLPFKNIDVLFQADNQNLRINQFSALGAGIPLSMPPTVIATKNANLLVYLKNDRPIEAKEFEQAINVPHITVSAGTANLSIPLEIQNNTMNISNATLKMQNALVQRVGDAYPEVFGSSDNYFIRTGQIIMDKNHVLQLALNGRLLPSKRVKDVQENDVHLSENIFKSLPNKDVPKDIQQRQRVLFGN